MHSFTLKGDETKDFNLLLYMDPDTPMEEDNMNASWKGKITLSSEYTDDKFINAGKLREVSSSDDQGMWEYKNKLIKIEIQDEIKSINEGELIYGPFDESSTGDSSIESYVICEAEDTNCIGYLQGDGGVKLNANSSNLFSEFSNVTNIIGLENLDTSEVTNMSGMFNSCSSLKSLDLSSFDTSNVTSLNNMFNEMSNLQELNLSNWKYNDSITSDFSKQSGLNTCTSLENIILENVDTSEVTDMSNMFASSQTIKELDLSSFDTSHVTTMSGIFGGAVGLTKINISNWNLSSLVDKPSMFAGNNILDTINAINIVFPKNSSGFFSTLLGLKNITLKNINTSSVTDMSEMFSICTNLSELDLSEFDTRNVTNFNNMFALNSNLQSITFGTNFVHKPEATIVGMFGSCPSQDRPSDSSWQDVSF